MKQQSHYKIAIMSIRLLLSIGLTILLCFYLPNYLNNKPPQRLINNKPATLEMALPEIEKQKLSKIETVEVKHTAAKVAPPLTMNLPIMAGVADTPVHQPIFVAPSIDSTPLPSLGPMTMGIKDVDQPPELLKYIQPQMPIAGRKYKDGGKVLLRLIVEANGLVSQVNILESNPEKVFDDSATQAARKWRFKPAILSGEAVKVFVDVPINFKVN
ncbi:TonB family protein [Shewanella sp. H8]|uniref:energy transducer TonB n=1 Tax=Shewanella sp. H8 TaxID=3342676 RepID=UPI003315FE99